MRKFGKAASQSYRETGLYGLEVPSINSTVLVLSLPISRVHDEPMAYD
jgi:hypothetical protein